MEKAKTDAQKVLSTLNGRKCIVWLDLEDKCQQKLGPLLKDIINAYRDIIVSGGYEFGIYTGPSFYNPFIKPYISQIKCDKWWLARYYNSYTKMNLSADPNEKYNPGLSTGISSIYAWQYTSSGQVPGISGDVDLSVIYGNTSSSPAADTILETAVTLLGKVNTKSGDLNIRSAPTSLSARIGTYKKGEVVSLSAKTSNNWYRVKTKDGLVGYVSGNYIMIL